MAISARKQLKTAKKQEKQAGKQQELQNIKARISAQKTGTPVPYGAQKKAGFFNSTEAEPTSISTLTPQQQQLIDQLSPLISGGLQNINLPGNPTNFENREGQLRKNFSEYTIPSIAERFAGLGNNGNSSHFQRSLANASSGFEGQLAALREQADQSQQGLQSSNLMNLLGAGLNPQFDYGITPGQNSGVRNIWNAAKGPALNAGLGALSGSVGGPIGTALGAAGGLAKGLGQQQSQANGSGVGSNSFGFQGQQRPAWQPQQNQMSTQGLASSGYPQLNDVFNQGQFKF
jgi:hypothetical protein